MKQRAAYFSIIAILGMALASLVALAVLRPTDGPLLFGVVIAFVAPTITSIVALLKIEQVHGLVNSRMSELLSLMRSQGQHEGRAQEKSEHQQSDATQTDTTQSNPDHDMRGQDWIDKEDPERRAQW